ncbi:MAG TPA: glycosyltransferase family 9 protein [Candidatus Acidoferrales bacterium]|jgi:ADP-heptose:LPS heptosyltransferase|nr:glycosyltransferase family 9 protein [Candidatus Acidoferrales bacterium]
MPQDSPSVLIIRLDAIGDALALAPLLAAFGEHAIPVDLVMREVNAGIFSSRAARRVLVAPFELRSSERPNLAAIDAFGAELSHGGYSHVLVATEDPGGYRLAGATRAPARIGFSNGWGKPFKAMWTRRFLTSSIYRSAGLDPNAPHECDVLFALGKPLLGDARPTHDAALLRPLVIENEPEPDDRVAMQITDKWERLGIATEDVVAMARRVAGYGGRFIAAEAERDYADELEIAAGIRIDRFDSLDAWKNAIAAASALVTPDSGALHVAGTIGTPVVGVFPASPQFDLQVARWSPWAAPSRIVQAGRDWPARAADALAQLL